MFFIGYQIICVSFMQERHIARMTPEEYKRMFEIPVNPYCPGEEYDSDVDSNEGYVRSFNIDLPQADEVTGVEARNNNNTIGSRERAQRVVEQLAEERRADRDISMGLRAELPMEDAPHGPQGPLEYRSPRFRNAPANNIYERALGSTDQVFIPARRATVPPPPTHRVPRLEDQDDAFMPVNGNCTGCSKPEPFALRLSRPQTSLRIQVNTRSVMDPRLHLGVRGTFGLEVS